MSVETMIVTLFTWVVLLIFPAWAAYRLFKRGQSKHAWATLLTIPIGLAWLVGIYSLTRPAGEPAVLETPCPSCQATEATQTTVTLDARTGERTPLLIAAVVAVGAGLAIIGGGLAIGITTWIEGDGGIIEWRYGSKVAGTAFILLGLSFGSPLIRYGLGYFSAERVAGRLNRCTGCGTTWTVLLDERLRATDDVAHAPASGPRASMPTCSEGPEGCWGPVFADEEGEPLCRGHLALREHASEPAHMLDSSAEGDVS